MEPNIEFEIEGIVGEIAILYCQYIFEFFTVAYYKHNILVSFH